MEKKPREEYIAHSRGHVIAIKRPITITKKNGNMEEETYIILRDYDRLQTFATSVYTNTHTHTRAYKFNPMQKK